jgi:hypothetical protein
MWQFEHEAKRNKSIIDSVLARAQFLEGYQGDNDYHRGMRHAASFIRYEINRTRQQIPRRRR